MQANISRHDFCLQTWGLPSTHVLVGSPSSVSALTVFSQDVGNYVSPVPAPISLMHLISLLQSSAEVYDEQEILNIARKVTKHVAPTFPRSVTGSQHVQGLVMLQGASPVLS